MATGSEIFPLISWVATVTGGNLTITVDTGGGPVAEIIAVPTSSVYGVKIGAPASLGTAAADSVAKLVETAVDSHTSIAGSGAFYQQTGYLYPAYRISISAPGLVSLSIAGAESLMRSLGLHGTPVAGVITVSTTTTSLFSTGFPVGVFAPCVPWSRSEPVGTSQAAAVRSPFVPSQVSKITTDTSTAWAIQWMHVPARHLSTYYAGLSAPAAVAGTSTSDTNGTLDALLTATLDNAAMLLINERSVAGIAVDVAWESNPKTDDLYEWDGENQRASVGVGLVQTA